MQLRQDVGLCQTKALFDEIAQRDVGWAEVQNRRFRGPLGPLPSMWRKVMRPLVMS